MVSPVPVILVYATLSGLLTSHLSQGYVGAVRREEQLENVKLPEYKLYPWEYVNTLQGQQGETRGQSGEVTPQHYRLTDEDLTQEIHKHAIKYKRETNTEATDNNNGIDTTAQNTEKYKLNMTYAETKDILKKLIENFSDKIDIPDSSEEIDQPFTADPSAKEDGLDITTPKYENIQLLNAVYNYIPTLIIPEQNNETLKVAREFEKAQNKTDIVLKVIEDRMKKLVEDVQKNYPDWIADNSVTTASSDDTKI